jgi:fucose 4-O-acetylase-like acetyltransferase
MKRLKGEGDMNKDIKLSNTKGVLIFLVVFGHLIAPYDAYNLIYLFIYSFHMPLFILLTGYFAKHVNLKKVANFLMILLPFHVLYRGFLALINPEDPFDLRLQVPYYHLWYMLATIFWYLIAIGINKSPLKNVNKAVIVAACFLIGTGIKFIAGPFEAFMVKYNSEFISNTFSYMRTLSFLPFFFLGFYLSEENMRRLYRSLKGNKLIPLLTAAGVIAYLSFANITNEEKIFKGNYGIERLDGSLLSRTGHILIAVLIAVLICYVLLNMIPDKVCFLTKWGDRTLRIFLFHAFFVMVLRKLPFLKTMNPWLLLPLLLLTALGVVELLSSDFLMKYTYYMWNPYKLIERSVKKFRENSGK